MRRFFIYRCVRTCSCYITTNGTRTGDVDTISTGGGDEQKSFRLCTTHPPSPETPKFRPERRTPRIPSRKGCFHQYRSPLEASSGIIQTGRTNPAIQHLNHLTWPADGFVISALLLMSTVGRKNREHYSFVSYLDETAMNVAQELGDNDLYNVRRTGKAVERPVRPSDRESSAFRSSVPRQITSPSFDGSQCVRRCTRGAMPGGHTHRVR